MVGFEYRVAVPEDEMAVTGLLKECYPSLMAAAYEAALLAAALPVMTQASPSLLSSGTYYVALTGTDQLVGCGGWTKEQPGTGAIEPGLGHIRHFGTHPAYVNLGIGRRIFDRCRADAAAKGIRRFEVYSSLNAEEFYAKLGFRRVHTVDLPMGSALNLPAILMDQTL